MPIHALLSGLLLMLPVAPGHAVVAEAAAVDTVAAERASPWRWPLTGTPSVLRYFAPPPVRWAAGHRGVDLAADPEEKVRAAGSGVVGYAGRLAGRGVVTVIHGELRTTYEPVTAAVVAGQRVRAGDVIGRLEPATGHCPGRSCLHWGLLRGDVYLDPLLLVRPGPSRLLPIFGGLRSTASQLPGAGSSAGSSVGSSAGLSTSPQGGSTSPDGTSHAALAGRRPATADSADSAASRPGLRTAAVVAGLASSVIAGTVGALLLAAPVGQHSPSPRAPPAVSKAGRPAANRSYSSGAL
jgi:hypothetical protein